MKKPIERTNNQKIANISGWEVTQNLQKMASSLHLLIQVQPLPNFPSITAPLFPQKPFHIPSLTSLKPSNKPLLSKPLTVPFALTESSDSPNSLQPNSNAQALLQQLAVSNTFPHP